MPVLPVRVGLYGIVQISTGVNALRISNFESSRINRTPVGQISQPANVNEESSAVGNVPQGPRHGQFLENSCHEKSTNMLRLSITTCHFLPTAEKETG
jgi:hypothetical protein